MRWTRRESVKCVREDEVKVRERLYREGIECDCDGRKGEGVVCRWNGC